MKPSRPTLIHAASASALVFLASVSSVHAAGGSWNVNAAGNWSATANWTPAAIPGTAAGDAVNLQFNITAARTVTIDTTVTVGDLNIGDPTATLFGYTLAGTAINFDGPGTTAATVDYTAAIANTISAPMTLVDNVIFRSNVNAVMLLSGVISGAGKTVTFNNDTNGTANVATALQGQFNVTGANTYSGGTSISDVRVAVATSDTALGTGNVTIASGGQVFCASARTLGNTFTIAGNGWAETAAGQPFGALRVDNGAIVSGAVIMTTDSALGTQAGTGTVNGVISGNFNFTKRGPAALILGAANTYTGTTTVQNGQLQLNNNTAASTGSISLATGAPTSNRIVINGGVTIANNISIPATTGTAGRGVIEQVGTGLGTVNGAMTITGAPSAGGHFVGGSSAANALVLAGPISSTAPLSQRDKFVIWKSGGTGFTGLTVTGTAIVGVNDGLSTAAVVTLGGSANTNLDLNGFNQSLAGITRNANTCIIGNSSTTADSTLTITGSSIYSGNITDAIAPGTRKVNLAVSGGTLTLSGTNNHTGTTNVTSGSLIVTRPLAHATGGNLSVSSGAKFAYQPTAVGVLSMGSGTNTFASGSTLGGAIGGINSESVTAFPADSGTSGNITVEVWAVPGAAVSPGTHNLFTATSGLDAPSYTLGNIYNATDFTVSNLAKSGTAVSVDVTSGTPLATAYWKGGLAGAATVWSASNGSTQSNWVGSLGGASQSLIPGAGADVVFSNSAVTTAPISTTLGTPMSLKSLTISDTANGMSLLNTAQNHSLTIGAGGLTMSSGVPASSLGAPVVVTSDQVWTNDSANALTLSSSLGGAAFGLTKNGSGAIIVTGAATLGSALNVNAGSLTLTTGTLANSPISVAPGASLTTGAVISGSASLSTSGITSISGANTYTGATDVVGGSLTMTGGTVSGSSLNVASGASFNQTGGVLSGTWNLETAGITTLAGTNTFTGDINLTGGVLQVGLVTGALNGNLGPVTTPLSFSKYINFSNGGTLRNTTTFNNNVGTAAIQQFIFNFGTGDGTLDVPTGLTLTIDDGSVAGNANNAAQLQGSGNLTKIGAGTLSLGNGTSNYATFTGQIFVNEGTLTTGAVSANPFGDTLAGTTVNNGATLNIKGVDIGAEPITINGLGVGLAGAFVSSTGAGGIASGPITVASASSFGGAGTLTLTGALSGSAGLTKVGVGAAVLSGDVSGFSGNLTLSEGTLTVPDAMSVGALTVSAGTLTGEITSTSMTLDGGTLLFDPNTADKLATGALTVNGTITLDITGLAPANTTVTAISATSLSGTGSFVVANAASYRTAPTVTATNSGVTVFFGAGKNLVWTGSGSAVWDVNSSVNWNDGVNQNVFYSGDSVTFPDGAANPLITLTGLLAPAGLAVTSNTTNYFFTATAGNQITGGTGLTKTGASTLTLTGANAYNGVTTVGGGVLSHNGTNNIGSGNPGNGIALGNGGKLRYTGTAALSYGASRSLAVGSGGGTVSHSSGTAATTTIPGPVTGSGELAFLTEGTGAGTFTLSGDNSGYTGAISVGAASTGLSTLTIASPAALPAASSITLNYPASGATGNASVLSLPADSTLPVGTTLNMTSFLNGAISLRTQVTTTGAVAINGPVKLSGNTICQFNPAAGSVISLNGGISEVSPGSFVESTPYSNTLFLRSAGTIIVNSQINLPSAGSTVAVTDGAVVILNSASNTYSSTSVAYGTVRLGAHNALPTTARLSIGQAGNQVCTLDLNGFDQTVTGLEWFATTGNLLTKGVSNTHPTDTSTFTINQATAPTTSFNGTFSGNINLVKTGPAATTLLASNIYTGSTTINAGTVVLGNAGALSNSAVAVNAGGTLDLGGQTIANTVALAKDGTLTGFGGVVAAADTVSGIVSPGSAAGTISFSNNSLTFAATAELKLEVGGTAPGSFDVVGANGPITFISGSVVTLTLINGFVPVAGDSFDFLAEDGGITSAATFVLPALSGGLVWNTAAFATSGVISVTSADPVAAYAASFGLTGADTAAGSDPDHDGFTNALEYALGINPTQRNGSEYRGIPSLSSGNLRLTYRRPSTLPAGLTASSYVVQFNTAGLAVSGNWANATAGVDYNQTITPLGGGVDSVTINFINADSGRKFARISVSY